MPKALDLIVFGATGFTGRLVAEHLNARYGVGGDVSWAMAGRSLAKMREVCTVSYTHLTLPTNREV